MNAHEPESTELRIEQTRLVELEAIVERGLATFVEVGNALCEIRDSGLYRPDFINFKHYCSIRWEMSRPRAYQLIQAALVASNLSTVVDIQPTSERQVRPLAKLEPDQQREAWKMATDATPNPTAEEVARVAESLRNRKNKPPKPPKPSKDAKPAEYCQVGWILLTAERDLAVLALTPENAKWKESALGFFESLRIRKIVTVL